jgi:hypothetical protein
MRIIRWALLSLLLWPAAAFAQYDGISNAFVVSPAKLEVALSPGENGVRNLYITNRLGRDAEFVLTAEDASASSDRDEIVKYYGQSLGPYSLKNYVMLGSERVSVSAGETKVVPVMVSLPLSAKPGGLYGAVMVSTGDSGQSGPATVSRAAVLLFVRVKGAVLEKSELANFSAGRRLFLTRAPIEFRVAVENSGNVYLNPYGLLEIKNWRARPLEKIAIAPWFVFPDSVRATSYAWTKPAYGLYSATLYLNRGHSQTEASEQTIRFVVLPGWPAAIVLILALIALFWRKFKQRFK